MDIEKTIKELENIRNKLNKVCTKEKRKWAGKSLHYIHCEYSIQYLDWAIQNLKIYKNEKKKNKLDN